MTREKILVDLEAFREVIAALTYAPGAPSIKELQVNNNWRNPNNPIAILRRDYEQHLIRSSENDKPA